MNTKTVLITGARAFVSLDLAKIFKHAGYRVVCADSLRFPLCRFSKWVDRTFKTAAPSREFEEFVSNLQEIIIEEEVDLVVPTCEEIFYISQAQERLGTSVCVDEFEKLDQLHNKWTFYQLLCELGLEAPKSRLRIRGQLVVKPVYSRFSSSIRRENSPLEIEQVFIEGESLCSYSICNTGQIVAHCTYRPLMKQGAFGPATSFEAIHDSEVMDYVQTVVSALEFSGQISFDFIRGSNLVCIECNPRTTSGLHLFDGCPSIAGALDSKHEGVVYPKVGLRSSCSRVVSNLGFFRRSALCLSLVEFGVRALKERTRLRESMTADIAYNGVGL